MYVVNAHRAYHTGIHYAEAIAELEKGGRAATEAIEALATRDNIRCRSRIIRGKPHKVIIEVAEEEGADCIVVGSTGMSAFERVMIGSESEKIVRFARYPVLLVHQAKQQEERVLRTIRVMATVPEREGR